MAKRRNGKVRQKKTKTASGTGAEHDHSKTGSDGVRPSDRRSCLLRLAPTKLDQLAVLVGVCCGLFLAAAFRTHRGDAAPAGLRKSAVTVPPTPAPITPQAPPQQQQPPPPQKPNDAGNAASKFVEPFDCAKSAISNINFVEKKLDLPYPKPIRFTMALDGRQRRNDLLLYGKQELRGIDLLNKIVTEAKAASNINNVIMIDVGSHFGWWSFAAVHFGVPNIYAVEAYANNMNYMCKTMELNKQPWQGTKLPVLYNARMGATGSDTLDAFYQSVILPEQQTTKVSKTVILKIDVDRNLYDVIMGAKQLFRSGLIKHLFMYIEGESLNQEQRAAILKVVSEDGKLNISQKGTYRGPGKPVHENSGAFMKSVGGLVHTYWKA